MVNRWLAKLILGEKEESLSARIQAVEAAVRARWPTDNIVGYDECRWVQEVTDVAVIVSYRGGLYRLPYTVDSAGAVVLGDEAEPVQVTYTPKEGRMLSTANKAAPTKTEDGIDYPASDYADVPDADKPSTWKLRMAEGSSGNVTVAQVGRAITAMQPGGFRGQEVALGSGREKVVSRIYAAIDAIDGATQDQRDSLHQRLAAVKGLLLQKGDDGVVRWLAVPTNQFEDREGEILTEAAHKAYVAAVESGEVEPPELWVWHTPGTRLGQAEGVAYTDGFVLAWGTIDKGQEDVAERLAALPDLAMSHGFMGVKEGSLITRYVDREISVLPAEAAANVWTAVEIGGADMALSDKQRAFLGQAFGEEKVAEIEGDLKGAGDALRDAGIAHKSADTPAPAPAPDVAPPDVKGLAQEIAAALDLGGIREAVQSVAASVATVQTAQAEGDKALKDILARLQRVEQSEDVLQRLVPLSLSGLDRGHGCRHGLHGLPEDRKSVV